MLLKSSPAESTLPRLCGELRQHTSAHGIPNVFRAAHWCRRLLWAVFVGFALCCALWQCTEMVLNYYRYPSHEKITLVSNTMLAFPAVTICNLNSVRYSSVRKSVAMTKSLQDLGLKQSYRRNKSSCWNTTCPDAPPESDSYPRALRKFASQFNQISDEEKIAMGHQLEDMLIFCNFHGQMCDTSFFSGFVNYKFGNCYTFNSEKTTDIRGAPISGAALNTTRAGFVYGRHLELFIQQIEYVKDVTHSAGIRLLVHDHAATPFPEDEGVNIPPGTETDIGMMKVLIKRLKSPYGSHCTDGDGIKNFYHDVYGSRYTRESCKRTCAQLSIMENCGCSHWEFAAPPDLQYPKCNLSAVGVSECVELYGYKFTHGMLPCDCPLQCKDNLVKVVVYYQQLNSEQIEEEPSVSEIDLISSMGGLVGLWVGFSICTLAEFFELFVDMLVFFVRRCLWKAVPNTYANPCSERGRASFAGQKTTNM